LQVTLYDPYLSASEVVFHEEALYQVYLPRDMVRLNTTDKIFYHLTITNAQKFATVFTGALASCLKNNSASSTNGKPRL